VRVNVRIERLGKKGRQQQSAWGGKKASFPREKLFAPTQLFDDLPQRTNGPDRALRAQTTSCVSAEGSLVCSDLYKEESSAGPCLGIQQVGGRFRSTAKETAGAPQSTANPRLLLPDAFENQKGEGTAFKSKNTVDGTGGTTVKLKSPCPTGMNSIGSQGIRKRLSHICGNKTIRKRRRKKTNTAVSNRKDHPIRKTFWTSLSKGGGEFRHAVVDASIG